MPEKCNHQQPHVTTRPPVHPQITKKPLAPRELSGNDHDRNSLADGSCKPLANFIVSHRAPAKEFFFLPLLAKTRNIKKRKRGMKCEWAVRRHEA
jgi:hypothetical protein